MKALPASLHVDSERSWRGGQQQVLCLLEGLLQKGLRAELAAKPDSPLFQRAKAAGITVHSLTMRGECDVLSALRLARLVRKHDFQILHAHSSHAHCLCRVARMFSRRVRLVVTRRLDSRIRHNLGNRFKYFTGVDKFIAISEAVRDKLIASGIFPDRIAIAPDGVDPARFEVEPADLKREFSLAPDSLLLGVVGHLVDKHKGQKDFIAAAAAIAPDFPQARFLIVGEGEDRIELEKLVRDLNLQAKVIFTGFRNDIPAVMRVFDVLVMPSRFEALGSTAIEAMVSGLPVIASNVGGLREAVVHNSTGLLLDTGDVAGLAAACRCLLADPELRRSMGQKGRERALELYSADRMIDCTVAAYEEVLLADLKSPFWKTTDRAAATNL